MGRLIDADALFDVMAFHVTSVSVCATVDEAYGMTRMKEICLEDVNKAPTVDAVPVVHGKWIAEEYQPHFTCSVCGHWFSLFDKTNYCPNCGARMDGRENDG